MDWDGLKKDWRIWLLVISLIVSLSLIVNPLDPYERKNGKIRLDVNIKQGLDLQGGARVLIRPTTNVSDQTINQIMSTLQTRISAFGLQEMDIRKVSAGGSTLVQIELAGANTSDLTELINRTGRFEARIPVKVADGEQLTVGQRTYNVELAQDTVTIGNETYRPGANFTLASAPSRSVQFIYRNKTGGRAWLSALAFSGEDVLAVDIDPQVSGVTGAGDQWQFRFQISISQTAARRFHDIVQHYPRQAFGTPRGPQLVLTLDDSRVSQLSIQPAFRSQVIQQPLVTGGAQSRKEAAKEMQELKSVLKSGALPVPIEIVSTTTVSATLGAQFLQTAIIAIVVAILAVAALIFVRYRDPRIVVPLTVTGFSELVMILGFAAFVNWTIDLPSIAGIIAAVGTGVDDQIIITDERGKRKRLSFKKRFKRAFFIIFTSAASTIAAMLPLMNIGAGAITGFAVTTIVGVLIGVSITRPAYARVLQYMGD